jgi:pyridine nucleotide-disulfide oxidoreductase family protein
VKRLLLVGAGHAHAVVLLALARNPLPDIRVALVTPQPTQVYSGMLPGVIAGHYSLDEASIDFAAAAQRANVEFIEGALARLDPAGRSAQLADGREIEYEVASLNVGSLVDRSVPGAAEHALPVKPFDALPIEYLAGKKHLAIIGAGAGGVELAMAFRHRGCEVTLYSERSTFPPAMEKRVAAALRRRRVNLLRLAATSIEPGPVVMAGATRADYEAVMLASGAVALPWLARSGLETDERGFIRVNERLMSVSHPDVFASGDCASLNQASAPKSGVYAVKQGAVLAHNLRAYFSGLDLRPYLPQERALSLLSCGDRYAIAQWGGWTAQGRWAWYWKNAIDRRWVRRFRA